MKHPSTKPYLIRAIYEWCCECGYTPLLIVKVDSANENNFPSENIKDGEIIFNVNQNAVRNLNIGNDIISFSARFNGVSREISFSNEAVSGVFAREINQGIAFPEVTTEKEEILKKERSDENVVSKIEKVGHRKKGKASLRLIK